MDRRPLRRSWHLRRIVRRRMPQTSPAPEQPQRMSCGYSTPMGRCFAPACWCKLDPSMPADATLMVLSLQTVFVGLSVLALVWQIHRLTTSLKQDAYYRAVDYYIRLNELPIQHPQLAKDIFPPELEFPKFSADNIARYQYIALILGFYERLYLLHCQKWIDKKTWDSWERWFEEVLIRGDMFQTHWHFEGTYFHDDFAHYVNQLIERTKNP